MFHEFHHIYTYTHIHIYITYTVQSIHLHADIFSEVFFGNHMKSHLETWSHHSLLRRKKNSPQSESACAPNAAATKMIRMAQSESSEFLEPPGGRSARIPLQASSIKDWKSKKKCSSEMSKRNFN